jgi:ADP-heptose:LPS heptosyltransferase
MSSLCRQGEPLPVSDVDTDHIRRIAVWQFGGVGDMLLATPVIEALGRKYPEAEIHLWCSDPSVAGFLKRFPQVMTIHSFRVYDFDSRTLMRKRIRKQLRSICAEMSDYNADLLVNLHIPALLDWWAVEWWLVQQFDVAHKLGMDPHFIRGGSVYDISLNAKARDGVHYTHLYRQLLEKADIECGVETVFPILEEELASVRTLLDDTNFHSGQSWVCMHIGARRLKMENRMWPVSRFSALAAKLLDQGITPVLIGVESEHDMGDQLCDEVPGTVSLIGKTEIGEMAALIHQANGFIGHDSGPFHVAVAVGTSALAICGRPDSEPEYLNYQKRGVSVFTRDEPTLISVDEVFSEILRLLDCSADVEH